MPKLKSIRQIHDRLAQLAKDLVGTEGSQAHGIRSQIKALKWVLNELGKGYK